MFGKRTFNLTISTNPAETQVTESKTATNIHYMLRNPFFIRKLAFSQVFIDIYLHRVPNCRKITLRTRSAMGFFSRAHTFDATWKLYCFIESFIGLKSIERKNRPAKCTRRGATWILLVREQSWNGKWRGYLSQGANRENSRSSRIAWINVTSFVTRSLVGNYRHTCSLVTGEQRGIAMLDLDRNRPRLPNSEFAFSPFESKAKWDSFRVLHKENFQDFQFLQRSLGGGRADLKTSRLRHSFQWNFVI